MRYKFSASMRYPHQTYRKPKSMDTDTLALSTVISYSCPTHYLSIYEIDVPLLALLNIINKSSWSLFSLAYQLPFLYSRLVRQEYNIDSRPIASYLHARITIIEAYSYSYPFTTNILIRHHVSRKLLFCHTYARRLPSRRWRRMEVWTQQISGHRQSCISSGIRNIFAVTY